MRGALDNILDSLIGDDAAGSKRDDAAILCASKPTPTTTPLASQTSNTVYRHLRNCISLAKIGRKHKQHRQQASQGKDGKNKNPHRGKAGLGRGRMGQEESSIVDETIPPTTLESRDLEGVAKLLRHGKAKRVVVMVRRHPPTLPPPPETDTRTRQAPASAPRPGSPTSAAPTQACTPTSRG